MIYLKIHKTEKGDLIAMCDEKFLGKVFNEGKAELNLKTYSDFYNGDLVEAKQAAAMIDVRALYSANIVGPEAIKVVIEKGIAQESEVKSIAQVPYLHIYTML